MESSVALFERTVNKLALAEHDPDPLKKLENQSPNVQIACRNLAKLRRCSQAEVWRRVRRLAAAMEMTLPRAVHFCTKNAATEQQYAKTILPWATPADHLSLSN